MLVLMRLAGHVGHAGLTNLDAAGARPAAFRTRRAKLRAALALLFLGGASLRLVSPDGLMQTIPPSLPWRRVAVYLSGLCEVLGAIGLLVPSTRRAAGLGLAALLVVVFPANVNVAVNTLHIKGYPTRPLYQWARLPLQPLLIWLVLLASRRDPAER